MKNKGASFVWVFLGILLVFAFALLCVRFLSGEDDWICDNGVWVKHGQPSTPMPSEKCEKKDPNVFSKTGNLVKGEKETFWSLLYEEPGSPALKIKLVFSPQSICKLGLSNVSCDDELWGTGARALAEGSRSGNSLKVTRLTVYND